VRTILLLYVAALPLFGQAKRIDPNTMGGQIYYEIRALRDENVTAIKQMGALSGRVDKLEGNIQQHVKEDDQVKAEALRSHDEMMQWVRGGAVAFLSTVFLVLGQFLLSIRHNRKSQAMQAQASRDAKDAYSEANHYAKKLREITARVGTDEHRNDVGQEVQNNRLDHLEEGQ
jgi:hypothetical protein